MKCPKCGAMATSLTNGKIWCDHCYESLEVPLNDMTPEQLAIEIERIVIARMKEVHEAVERAAKKILDDIEEALPK